MVVTIEFPLLRRTIRREGKITFVSDDGSKNSSGAGSPPITNPIEVAPDKGSRNGR